MSTRRTQRCRVIKVEGHLRTSRSPGMPLKPHAITKSNNTFFEDLSMCMLRTKSHSLRATNDILCNSWLPHATNYIVLDPTCHPLSLQNISKRFPLLRFFSTPWVPWGSARMNMVGAIINMGGVTRNLGRAVISCVQPDNSFPLNTWILSKQTGRSIFFFRIRSQCQGHSSTNAGKVAFSLLEWSW